MSQCEFSPHKGPHCDFFIIKRSLDNELVRNDLVGLGAKPIEYVNHTVYWWGEVKGSSDVLLTGFGVIDGSLMMGPKTLHFRPKKITVGACVVIDISEGDIRIHTDVGGMHSVYYNDGIVTNRLHLAKQVIKSVDWASAYTSMHSNSMFSQQFSVTETPVSGVRLLPPGWCICFSNNVEICSTWESAGSDYSPLSPDEYQKLISDAAQEIVNNVTAIVDAGFHVVCDVTGGKDSRILLAAVVAADRVSEVSFNTKYSESSALANATVDAKSAIQKKVLDRDIATGLVRRYGGVFSRDFSPIDFYQETTEERLNSRRSQLFGSYHFVQLAQLNGITPIFNKPVVRMMGGCGETYRDYYQPSFLPNGDMAYDGKNIINLIEEKSNHALKDFYFENSKNKFIETFNSLPGYTVGDKLDSHYLRFRNRFHFGANLSRNSLSFNISPIFSPYLIKATRGLPSEEKSTGRVLFDVTKELCEELPYIHYDKPFEFNFRDSVYHKRSPLDGAQISVAPAPELLQGIIKKPRVSRPKAEKINFPDLCYKESIEALDSLLSQKVISKSVYNNILKILKHSYHNRPTRLASWMSRLQAFVDYS